MKNQSLVKSERSNALSVRDGAGLFFRRKSLIFLTFLTVALGTLLVTLLTPNEYESHMKILVKNTRSDVPVTPERTMGTTGATSENDVSENQINSEIELLKSKDLLSQVVTECGLQRVGLSLSQRIGLKPGLQTEGARVQEAVERLSKELSIEPIKKSNIIEIKYASTSPEQSAAVLRKLQDLYLEKHLRLHRPPGTYDFFKGQTDQYEGQLRDTEKEFSNFQQTNNVVLLAQQKEQTVMKLAESRSKLLETEAFLKDVNGRIDRVQQQLRALPARVVTQSRALPNQYSAERLNTMIVELQNKRTQLLTKFRADDRLVREVDEQIRTTRAALQKATNDTATEQSTDLNPLKQTLETELARARVDQAGAQGRLATLAGQVGLYETQLSRLEGITAQYDDMTRKVKQSADNYELYNKKQEEARIADELDQNKITNVSVAEAPILPQLPVRPNRPLNLVLGVVLGALLSAGSVLGAEFFRETVNTPRELEAMTGAPVLAALPEDGGARRGMIVEKKMLSLPKTSSEPELEFASGD